MINWACMKIKRVVICIKKKEPWTWKRVGEEWRCPFSEELCRCCFRRLLLTLKESIPTSPISLSLSLAQMYPNFCFLNNIYISLIINCLVRFRLVLAEVWSYQIFICFVGGGGHCWCGLVLHQQSIEWTWWSPLIISVWSDYWFVICDFLSMIFLPLIFHFIWS